MSLDVVELRQFYGRPLGVVVRRLLSQRLHRMWPDVRGMTVMGLGFAPPYLGSFRGRAHCLGALMPATQGVIAWPGSGLCQSTLVKEDALPFPDASVDRLLAVHSLEMTEPVRPLLREAWRVLKPEGRLLAIVPNRRSIWSRLEATPFGHGRPYSRRQLEQLLQEALFTVTEERTALHMPPSRGALMLSSAPAWERLGSRLWPAFSGVIMMEASKELAAPIGKTASARRARGVLKPERVRITPRR